ncbi:DUF305 domain-containing protein [Arthrobacter sp. EH-1B-1]|uniref:DUF305 domain-containing protein n=1 Tax=Arthrobacter vasquezii TaxID=2977629 RepID=A0ABT6CTJ4_9MICC|nr:DUF305 domain-containing protein [Arthrobacter vasquezii]MDF9276837.1 DUF305 domain-containing protein [Arthrobacter vasquezii]
MKRYLSLSALGVAAVVMLAGCGAADPGESAAGSSGSEVSGEHNDADVMFAQMMIPHHEQAVQMSDVVLAKDGLSPEITELATQVKDAQAPEIETMTGWLDAWGEPVEGHHMESADGEDGMDGMLSEDQMGELEVAQGEEAARMFLESMTAHHNGAVDMAQEEIENGENPEAIALAEDIVETQEAEIEEMKELLAEL